MRRIFVREIILTAGRPPLCPACEKDDRLEKDIIKEERSGGRTVLCARCEALVVITSHNLRQVELTSRRGDIIMLKEPHLIRRVAC